MGMFKLVYQCVVCVHGNVSVCVCLIVCVFLRDYLFVQIERAVGLAIGLI